MPTPDPAVFYGVALDLLDCVVAQMGEEAPEFRCVVPGSAIHDGCCDGALTVSLIRWYDSQRFPDEFNGALQCGQSTVVLELAVTVLRCAAQIDSNGIPPSCDEQAATALQTAKDAYHVRAAAACCFDDDTVAVSGGQWIDVEDGCTGTISTVRVDVGSVCCNVS